jgi:hypothetical protein
MFVLVGPFSLYSRFLSRSMKERKRKTMQAVITTPHISYGKEATLVPSSTVKLLKFVSDLVSIFDTG